jgi:AAA+ superfamily predicted ATPase
MSFLLHATSGDNFSRAVLEQLVYSLGDSATKEVVGIIKERINASLNFASAMRSFRKNTMDFLKYPENVLTFTFSSEISNQLQEVLQITDVIIDQMRNPKVKVSFVPSLKLLLAGPAGVGKTAIMRNLIAKFRKNTKKVKVLVIDGAELKQFNEETSLILIKRIFEDFRDLVKKGYIVILGIDEIDCLFGINKDVKTLRSSLITSFLYELNEITFLCENIQGRGNFIFFGTTNLVGLLDEAFARRFNFYFTFGLPSANEKEKIYLDYINSFKKVTKIQCDSSEEFVKFVQFISSQENILTPSDLKIIIRNSFSQVFTINYKNPQKTLVLTKDIIFIKFIQELKKKLEFNGFSSEYVQKNIQDIKEKFENLSNSSK